MSQGYNFNRSSVKKIGRSVNNDRSNPLTSKGGNSRRVWGQGGKASGVITPFFMSLKKSDEDEQLVNITSGRVFVDDTTYDIEENNVNIDSYSIGDTVYIYLKVEANWLDGAIFKGYPTLTVLTGEEIENSNFASNSTQFPLTDLGHVFYDIGTVLIEDNGSGGKKHTLSQVAYENVFIESMNMSAFITNKIHEAKTTDSQTDNNYTIFVNAGQVVLPESQELSDQYNFTISNTSDAYAYIKITGVQASNGGWSNFTYEITHNASQQIDTDSVNYYLISFVSNGVISQQRLGTFDSGGRIQ
jgi:hypothetical protein